MGLFDLASDLVNIALTPVHVVTKVAEAAVRPVAGVAEDIRDTFDELLDD